jgi:hemoglobin-like flavoprotein
VIDGRSSLSAPEGDLNRHGDDGGIRCTTPRSLAKDPAMTPNQQELVRSTWAQVVPIADTAASLFYERLFTLDPSLRRLFRRTDMEAQRRNLVQTLAVVVKGIDDLERLLPAVQALGRRHAGYGVRPSHYATVGQALLDTLAAGLGEAFTPSAHEAWAEAYGILAGAMIAAGDEAKAA